MRGLGHLAVPLLGVLMIAFAGAESAGSVPALAAGRPAGSPGTAASLRALVCTSSANCWAVGYYEVNGALLNQALHWKGKHWSLARIPSPGGTRTGALSELYGVRCRSSSSCWAVGYYLKGDSGVLTEALRWNGTNWSQVATPDPAGKKIAAFNSLSDVACTSADNCWAAGEYTSSGHVTDNLILRWNGAHWTRESVPNPGGAKTGDSSTLQSIRCVSASDCWAVGTYGQDFTSPILRNEVLHWNGSKWSKTSAPNPQGTKADDENELQALACSSARNCLAVGRSTTSVQNSPARNEALAWNGTKWSQHKTPDPGGTGPDDTNSLTAISCSAPQNCWAVGILADSQETFRNEALLWNGHGWTSAPMPQPAGTGPSDTNDLYGVSCTGSANCWAVGNQAGSTNPYSDLILHWNGVAWTSHKVD
jgi:hypothetical protein